jgi:regulator of RNase E activity RraA
MTATAQTITSDGQLKTGDIAIIDTDGYVFVDRLKEFDQIQAFKSHPNLEATRLRTVRHGRRCDRGDPIRSR